VGVLINYIEMTFVRCISYILSEFCSILYLSLWDREYHRAIITIESGTQELTHEFADLLDREVHHSNDLFSDEFLSCIVYCDLCTGLFDSYITAKIYPDLVCGFPCFWIWLCSDDGTDSELYGFELVPGDFFLHGMSIGKSRISAILCYRENIEK
jgi:hypothetical protein